RYLAFVLFFILYLFIVFANVIIIVVTARENALHEPMYIFIMCLAVNSLYGSAGFFLRFLRDLLSSSHLISRPECFVQIYVIYTYGSFELSFLSVMAYDRYVAVCQPLHYHNKITKKTRVSVLGFLSWFIPLYCMFMNSASLFGVKLCSSHIGKVYCVNWMIVTIACSPPRVNSMIAYFNILLYFGHFVFIIWSYIYMIRSCLSSKEDQRRFMQTCLPHLISLVVFSVTVLLDLMYMRFGQVNVSPHLSNFMAIEFLLIPPFVNPFIYGFKLTKVWNRIASVLHLKRKVTCQTLA
uniref:Olfactory receptor n=1 Tax=Tetraodon nigroviridis TaxID=99883 RepID=H3BW73_TETNG